MLTNNYRNNRRFVFFERLNKIIENVYPFDYQNKKYLYRTVIRFVDFYPDSLTGLNSIDALVTALLHTYQYLSSNNKIPALPSMTLDSVSQIVNSRFLFNDGIVVNIQICRERLLTLRTDVFPVCERFYLSTSQILNNNVFSNVIIDNILSGIIIPNDVIIENQYINAALLASLTLFGGQQQNTNIPFYYFAMQLGSSIIQTARQRSRPITARTSSFVISN